MTATVLLQTSRDLAIVAGILAIGVLYDAAYLRQRRDTHWILLDPPVGEPDLAGRELPARGGRGCELTSGWPPVEALIKKS